MKKINFEDVILRKQISSRGGGIEISLSSFGFKDEKMSAYQNYLGGGMLGRVCVNDTIRSKELYTLTDRQENKLDEIGEQLKQYYFNLTNPSEEEWEHQSYEQNQTLPESAY